MKYFSVLSFISYLSICIIGLSVEFSAQAMGDWGDLSSTSDKYNNKGQLEQQTEYDKFHDTNKFSKSELQQRIQELKKQDETLKTERQQYIAKQKDTANLRQEQMNGIKPQITALEKQIKPLAWWKLKRSRKIKNEQKLIKKELKELKDIYNSIEADWLEAKENLLTHIPIKENPTIKILKQQLQKKIERENNNAKKSQQTIEGNTSNFSQEQLQERIQVEEAKQKANQKVETEQYAWKQKEKETAILKKMAPLEQQIITLEKLIKSVNWAVKNEIDVLENTKELNQKRQKLEELKIQYNIFENEHTQIKMNLNLFEPTSVNPKLIQLEKQLKRLITKANNEDLEPQMGQKQVEVAKQNNNLKNLFTKKNTAPAPIDNNNNNKAAQQYYMAAIDAKNEEILNLQKENQQILTDRTDEQTQFRTQIHEKDVQIQAQIDEKNKEVIALKNKQESEYQALKAKLQSVNQALKDKLQSENKDQIHEKDAEIKALTETPLKEQKIIKAAMEAQLKIEEPPLIAKKQKKKFFFFKKKKEPKKEPLNNQPTNELTIVKGKLVFNKKVITDLSELPIGDALIRSNPVAYLEELQILNNKFPKGEYMIPLLQLKSDRKTFIELLITATNNAHFFTTEAISLLTAVFIVDIYQTNIKDKKRSEVFKHTIPFLEYLKNQTKQYNNTYAEHAISKFITVYKKALSNNNLDKKNKLRLLKNSKYTLTKSGVTLLLGLFTVTLGIEFIAQDSVNVLQSTQILMNQSTAIGTQIIKYISELTSILPSTDVILTKINSITPIAASEYLKHTYYSLYDAVKANPAVSLGSTTILAGAVFMYKGAYSCKEAFSKRGQIKRVKK